MLSHFGVPVPNGPAGVGAGPAFGAGPRSGWPGWSYEGAHEGITLGERHRGKTGALQAEPRSGTGWSREPTGGSRAGFCRVGDHFDGRRVLGEAGHRRGPVIGSAEGLLAEGGEGASPSGPQGIVWVKGRSSRWDGFLASPSRLKGQAQGQDGTREASQEWGFPRPLKGRPSPWGGGEGPAPEEGRGGGSGGDGLLTPVAGAKRRAQGQDFPRGLALSQARSRRSHPCPGGESSP
jgi:hypothetical protein